MARKVSPRGRQEHPDGPVVTLDDDERKRLRRERENLGLTQRALATKAETTAATISNMETGRSAQPNEEIYKRVLRVLSLERMPAANAEVFRQLQDELVGISTENAAATLAFVRTVKTLKKTP